MGLQVFGNFGSKKILEGIDLHTGRFKVKKVTESD